MKQISDFDLHMAIRLLKSFALTKGANAREWDDRRKAKLLYRKLEKRK